METYKKLKTELSEINNDILLLFSKIKQTHGIQDSLFRNWEKTCEEINKHISDDLVRVAVVGPIKSGKSTFVNSLFKDDFLKRGAGIVTSFVTKIHPGNIFKAELTFKSIEEINVDIRQALVLFPFLNLQAKVENFNIKNGEDRADLGLALNNLNKDLMFTNGVRNIYSILLSSYLNGYDRIKDIISENITTICYKEIFFKEHKLFVTDDALSVYLKDIHLEINSDILNKNIEVADCQGSDSPNPLHLSMIQDYLFATHFIIYVISSRTGVREADVKFLSMIKKMGIMENIIFVINCDFNEHESIDTLHTLISNVKQNLSLLKTEPEIYSFSTLFNLFKGYSAEHPENNGLNKKDNIKFSQWKDETVFCIFSDQETRKFEISFTNKITKGRYRLLLNNHLGRINTLLAGVGNWIAVHHKILDKNTDSAREIIEKIMLHQGKIDKIMAMIKNTIDGAVQKIKQEQKNKIDKFFRSRFGEAPKGIVEFIRQYTISYDDYKDSFQASGFSSTIYFVFQEFKQRLDTFITERINPEIITLVRDQENSIKKKFESIAEPFESMVQSALDEYNSDIISLGITQHLKIQKNHIFFDLDYIKSITGLGIPSVSARINYSAKIKTEAAIRLSFYAVIRFIKQIFKKAIINKKEGEVLALRDSLLRIKREAEKSVIFYFKNYRENLKFQYIFKLIDAVSNSLYKDLLKLFSHNLTALSGMVELIESKQIDKKKTIETLRKMETDYSEICKKINVIKEQIEKQ